MKSVDTGFTKSKYLEVSELGSRYNLSFSSQLELGDKLIALDGVRKCLLVVQTDKEVGQPTIIDLNKVSAVTVRKNYGRINPGELKNKTIDEFLERVDLHFLFRSNDETLVLPFYDSERDDKKDRAKLA